MSDWKSALLKAKESLGLDGKPKVESAKPALAVRQLNKKSASNRPAFPEMPGLPEGFKPEPRVRERSKAVDRVVDAESRAWHSGKHGDDTSRQIQRKKPSSLDQRQRTDSRTSDKSVASSKNGLAAQAVDPGQQAGFLMPDMSKYSIRHSSCTSLDDQSWQSLGTATTFVPSENRGRSQCIVGLDFGTAFTKSCVQFRQSTFVVQWSVAVSGSPSFLLPGVFSIRSDGTCVLGTEPDIPVHGDLKMRLFTGAEPNARVLAVVFLALVTRYIRSWLFSHHGDVFRGFQIEWFVNVGLPAVPWDNLHLRKLYEEITLAGWRLGATEGPISVDAASRALDEGKNTSPTIAGHLQSDRICAFPEFVAQINSYRRSAQRRRDLHLLIDIGAGTIDIVTFHAWESDDGDCYSILDAAVEDRGTHVLLGHRVSAGNLREHEFDEMISRLSLREFEAHFGLVAGRLDRADKMFVDCVCRDLAKILGPTRRDRYATSPKWREGVPVFIAGGGNQVDAYREAIAMISQNWKLEEISLPLPEGVVWGDLPRTEFHRVSVAYGLSDSADNIGKIDRKSEVPDLLWRAPQERIM